jgi:hypothetical protein
VECKNKNDASNNRATGTVSKSLTKYLSNITPKHDIKELQQTAVLALHTYCGKYWCKVQNVERGK